MHNNLGTLQRFTGIFSRRGIEIKSLEFTDRKEGKSHPDDSWGGLFDMNVSFEGDEKLRKSIELQIEKMVDFVGFKGDSAARKD